MTHSQALLVSAALAAFVAVVSIECTAGAASDDFDRQAAASVLSSVDLAKCKSTNAPRGEGHILVKFTPAGAAIEAVVDKGPLVGTPVAKCIVKEFKKAKVPAFKGDVVQVGKSFRFE